MNPQKASPRIHRSHLNLDDYVVDQGHYIDLLIYHGRNGYPIDIDRIDTPQKLLGWVHHLGQKLNVSTHHLVALVEWFHNRFGGVNFDA